MTCKDVKELQALRLEVEGLKASNNHLLSGIKQVSRGIMSTGMRKHFNRLIACTPEQSLAQHDAEAIRHALSSVMTDCGATNNYRWDYMAHLFYEYANKLEAGE